MPVYRDRRACPLARPLPVAEARMRRGCRPGPVRHGFGTMEVRIAEYAVPSDQRIRSERDMMIAYQFEGSRRSKVLAQNQGLNTTEPRFSHRNLCRGKIPVHLRPKRIIPGRMRSDSMRTRPRHVLIRDAPIRIGKRQACLKGKCRKLNQRDTGRYKPKSFRFPHMALQDMVL